MAANQLRQERLRERIAMHEAEAMTCPLPQVRDRHLRAAESWRRELRQSKSITSARDERFEHSKEGGRSTVASQGAELSPITVVAQAVRYESANMNLKSLPPKVRTLVEGLEEHAAEAGYDIVDVEDDGDTAVVTFTRTLGSNEQDDEDDDDD